MAPLQLLVLAGFLVFVVATAARLVRYARTPVHLRWELYPVAHERGRHRWGGSVFEEPDWWRQPRDPDRANELREMAAEIFLMRGVHRHNRRLWFWSWPFHGGLYLLVLWLASLLIPAGPGDMGALVGGVTVLAGHGGLVLTAIGAAGLLGRRLGDRVFRRYSARSDYLVLAAFVAAALGGLVVYGLLDPTFAQLRAFTTATLRLRAAPPLPALEVACVLTGTALIALIPFTRMIHFAAKYFLYHEVRWSDEPLRRGSRLERRLQQAMNYGVSWRAPHMSAGRTWADAVAGDPATEETRS